MEDVIASLRAKLAEAERERDEAVRHQRLNGEAWQDRAESAEARAQRYREALTTCAEEGSVGARRALSADPLVCRDPDLCWGTGTCPRDPACNE